MVGQSFGCWFRSLGICMPIKFYSNLMQRKTKQLLVIYVKQVRSSCCCFYLFFHSNIYKTNSKKDQFYHSREILLKLVPYGYIISNFVYWQQKKRTNEVSANNYEFTTMVATGKQVNETQPYTANSYFLPHKSMFGACHYLYTQLNTRTNIQLFYFCQTTTWLYFVKIVTGTIV